MNILCCFCNEVDKKCCLKVPVMDVKRKATEGIVAIPAKKARNELALRYGGGNDYDENVSS